MRRGSNQKAPVEPPTSAAKTILAVGAHLKNSVALAVGENVFISQHIGDLETEPANNAFRRVIADFEKLYDAKPEIVAADLHPDYLSTKFADELTAGRAVPARRWHRPERDSPTRAGTVRPAKLASSTTSRMCCRAWRKMKSSCPRSASRGTARATARTARFGAENFSWSRSEAVERVAQSASVPVARRRHGGQRTAPRRARFAVMKCSVTRFLKRTDLPTVAAFSDSRTDAAENDAEARD